MNLRVNDKIFSNTINLMKGELRNRFPESYLDSFDVLKMYNLNSFDDVIQWTIDNDNLPFNTIKRIHNSAWKKNNNLNNLSENVFKYYFNISKNYWLKDYVKNLLKIYSFDLVGKKNEKINLFYILQKKIYTYNFFTRTLKDYLKKNKKNWNSIESHYDDIKKNVYNRLVQHIENIMSDNKF